METQNENISLKKDQTLAFDKLRRFIKDDKAQVFILKGYAGTGKTTMMRVLIEELSKMDIPHQLLASTGRAAKILSDKTRRDAKTVHGMIYTFKGLNKDLESVIAQRNGVQVDKSGQIMINFGLASALCYDGQPRTFYIVDESSMISDVEDPNASQAVFGSGRLLSDLLKYDCNGKFIFVGDICQLPPVLQEISPALSASYFKDNYNIDADEFELKEIIRQEQGNGIIESSRRVRMLYASNPQVKWVKFPLRGYNNIKLYPDQASLVSTYISYVKERGYNSTTMICPSNKNCLNLTELVRPALNFSDKQILLGDLLLVTQNNYISGLMNGDMVEITKIGEREQRACLTFVKVEVKELYTNQVYSQLMIENVVYGSGINLVHSQQKELFVDFYVRMKAKGIGQEDYMFEQHMMTDPYLNALRAVYGYALTCHKSQGGEWDDVFIDIGKSILFHKRPAVYQWIYTAMTRARKQLHLVGEWWID